MLPKRPISCLASLVLPVGVLLLLVALGTYAVKYFFPETFGSARVDSVNTEAVVQETAHSKGPVRFPASVSTSTRVLVAVASSDPAKEEIFSVDETGTAVQVKAQDHLRPEGWKTQGITLAPPQEQVTSSPWRITGNGWNVPLRTKSGAKWQDPVIWGLFSSGRLAVVAYRTQRALLSVSRAGDIQVVDVLDDELAPLAVQGKYAWFVAASTTERLGIEELPMGPSQLVRISETGTRSTVAEDPGQILDLIPSPSPSVLSYVSSDGSLVIVNGSQITSDIKGWRPLAWFDERYLLAARGRNLGWVDVTDPTRVTPLAVLPQSIRAATLSTSLDESVLK